MARSSNQKLKLLCLARIFIENTDVAHTLTLSQIADELGKYEISAERKSLYDDIECLRLFGLDICVRRDRRVGYYLGKRDFELTELKLLIDAVNSSKFITSKKSASLIKKIERLGGKHDAALLDRYADAYSTPKAENEEIFCNVDMISRAITQNRRICFKCFSWGIDKRREILGAGQFYCVSPWALVWYGEEYYMIAYDSESASIVPYRVDKMLELFVDRQNREGASEFEAWANDAYTKQSFGLVGEGLASVRLSCDVSLIDEVIDLFGKNIVIANYGGRFEFTSKVMLGNKFYAWVLSHGEHVKIITPESLNDKVRNLTAPYAPLNKEI